MKKALVQYKRTVHNTTFNELLNELQMKSKYLCNLIVYTAKGVHRNKSGGGNMTPPCTKKFLGGRKNLNRKFKTFGFLDTLKVNIQYNYLTSTTLSLLQTKLAEKTANYFFHVLQSLDLKSVLTLSSRGLQVWGQHCPLAPSL